MSQTEKAGYFRALKEAGVPFSKHYREYSTDDLREAYLKLSGGVDLQPPAPAPQPQPVQEPQFVVPPPPLPSEADLDDIDPPQPQFEQPNPQVGFDPDEQPDPSFYGFPTPQAPRADRDPNEMAGTRLNTHAEDEPIRTDEQGRVWFQEEILKPAFPKPRGRRVLTYMETGTKQQIVSNGNYTETFEVAGDELARQAEVKITLPSYQVGIFKDPRFPFRIHTYNGLSGFDLFEVQDYYHGPEMVPEEIKRVYVENVLCYDIRTTVRAIETEYRQLQLAGRI